MAGAEGGGPPVPDLLEEPDGLGGAAGGPVRAREVVQRGQGVGVVGAEDPLAVGQGLLEQRDRLIGPAR